MFSLYYPNLYPPPLYDLILQYFRSKVLASLLYRAYVGAYKVVATARLTPFFEST